MISCYLNVGEVYLVLFEEADELFEVVLGWEIVTTVWPYSLKRVVQIILLAKN